MKHTFFLGLFADITKVRTFKVNKGWSKALLLFLCLYVSYNTYHYLYFLGVTPLQRLNTRLK